MIRRLMPKVSRRIIDMIEMPRDVFLGLPKITVIGSMQMVIENHKGVLEYNPERIRIRSTQGEVLVSGRYLKLGSIASSELVIDGKIDGIAFNGQGGDV